MSVQPLDLARLKVFPLAERLLRSEGYYDVAATYSVFDVYLVAALAYAAAGIVMAVMMTDPATRIAQPRVRELICGLPERQALWAIVVAGTGEEVSEALVRQIRVVREHDGGAVEGGQRFAAHEAHDLDAAAGKGALHEGAHAALGEERVVGSVTEGGDAAAGLYNVRTHAADLTPCLRVRARGRANDLRNRGRT